MFDNLFGRERPVEVRRHSLITLMRLSSRYEAAGKSFYIPDHGAISLLGFAEKGSFELLSRAPLAAPAIGDVFYKDKFINLRSGEVDGCLGWIELKEGYVYDNHYRCDIDFTGLQLDLTLRPPAFEEYEQFIGRAPVPSSVADPDNWHGDLLLSIPAPIFEFPAGRGSAPPYPPARSTGAKAPKLRGITSFRFDAIDIIKTAAHFAAEEPPLSVIASTPPEQVLRLR